ncbi:MAG: transporter substrate-binding domain-containing protein, partial [Proteobacteria bacterium]|nr:transporter substrate-binding domain-containing protein [Pseudomonadota bacterium]
ANLVGKMLGVRIKHVSGAWEDIHKKAKNRKIDGIRLLVKNEAREEYLNFTKPLTELTHAVLVHQEVDPLRSLSDLAGKKVAMVRKSHGARYIADKYPGIHVVAVSTYEDGINALLGKKVDAFFGPEATITDVLTKKGITNLKIALDVYEMKASLSIGIRKDWPELIPILNKVLDAIPAEKHLKIRRKWLSPDVEAGKKLSLTAAEKAWLVEHERIRIGTMDAWPPFNFVDRNGKPAGIGAGYVQALNRRLDGALEIVPGDWKVIYEDVKEKRLDALMDITPKPGREAHFNFTQPYLNVPHVIVAKNDVPFISNEGDLIGKTLALERGFGNVKYFRENYPQVKIKEYRDTPHALGAVARGEADAYAGNRSVALYVIENEVISNLRIHGRLKKAGSMLSIGTRKDWPILRDILQKVLDDISQEEKRAIVSQWVAPEKEMPVVPVVALTPEEKAWLAAHPVLKLGYDIDWPPIEKWTKDEGLVGLSADFFSIIAQRLGVTIEPATPMDWVSMLELANKGELDLMSALVQTPQRDEFLDFTQPYLTFPMVIVTREEVTYIGKMNELNGKKVGVVAGYASQDYLTNLHPKIKIMPAQDVRKGLLDVVQGNTFAFVGNLATISHIIAREGLSEIKISGETPYKYDLRIGIRKGEPVLGLIMQKALDSISEEERGNIYSRWVNVTY